MLGVFPRIHSNVSTNVTRLNRLAFLSLGEAKERGCVCQGGSICANRAWFSV